MQTLFAKIIAKTHRVPLILAPFSTEKEYAAPATRQLDIALMSVGFKMSKDLLEYFSSQPKVVVNHIGASILDTVRELVGAKVRHNPYFKNFPEGVPDTFEFWAECIADALCDDSELQKAFTIRLGEHGFINLLDLPKYGRYQHSFEDMVESHGQFTPGLKDRLTVLHLGKDIRDEANELYVSMASGTTPLSEDDRGLFEELAASCLHAPQPQKVPVRETRALLNRVRLEKRMPLIVDTLTDVLRLACALSDGDVTLETTTKFKSLPRPTRRALIGALEAIVVASPGKLADVWQHREAWKRLGESLHPHEYNDRQKAQDVFKVARGEMRIRSLASRADAAFRDGDIAKAVELLSTAPGMLLRAIDRTVRASTCDDDVFALIGRVALALPKVSGRVILQVREHFQNRLDVAPARIFANSKGTAWTTPDARKPLSLQLVKRLCAEFDEELKSRLPVLDHLVVDASVMDIALPLSEKYKTSGFGVVPPGSISSLPGDIVRFFVYWKQKARRTDYDLSLLLLDKDFKEIDVVSYYNLRGDNGAAYHSGDLVEAPRGATEFIDIDFKRTRACYAIPSVQVYAGGEKFTDVEESFFGLMSRDRVQSGLPFEPRTVRMKSEMRGAGSVALPLVLYKTEDGWFAKWLHFYLKGMPRFNSPRSNSVSSALLARSVVDRDYIKVSHLVSLLRAKAKSFSWHDGEAYPLPVTYVGTSVPDGLPAGSKSYSLQNLAELVALTK